MLNFKPQKGKAFDKLPKKTLDTFNGNQYLESIKYDGNQIFISKIKDEVRFFTSDWKEFNLPTIGDGLKKYFRDFIMIAEMNYNSIGKLGDRTEVQGKITTERVNFAKGLPCSLDEDKVYIKVFDFLSFTDQGHFNNVTYKYRMIELGGMIYTLPRQLQIVKQTIVTGREAIELNKERVAKGWEGTMLMCPSQLYHVGKRVNHAIKLKDRPTADLLCTDVKYSEINPEDIGSLILKDSEGRVCAAGGLEHDLKRKDPEYFIGKIIEIKYEQILDTYMQPAFVCIREDKEVSE